MKKLLSFGIVTTIIVVTIMMGMSTASASLLTTRTYSNDDLTVQFETLYLDNIGTATLVSHNSVNEIKEVGWGEPKVVMWYDLDFEDIEREGLGDVKIIDMNTGKIVDKDYEYVIWGTVEYEFPLYKEVCSQAKNFSTTCKKELIGYETREREDWIKYDSRDIPKQARIGLRTMVNEGDYYDAIWTMVDEEITKHSEWTAGLDVNLLDYYNFENGTGDTAIDRVAGEYNMTGIQGSWTTDGGIQGSGSFRTNGLAMTSRAIGSLGDITINMWINITGNDVSDTIVGNGLQNGEFIVREGNTETNLDWIVEDSAGYTDYPITKYQWHMVTLRFNNSVGYFIIDGVVMDVQAINPLSSQVLTFGGEPESTPTLNTFYDEIIIWNRTLSTAEIAQLYNGGVGLLYNPFAGVPNVTQNAPVNYYNSSSSDVTFNCSATDDKGILNISLFIGGIFNLSISNTTASQNLSLETTLGFPDGIHNWSCNTTDTTNTHDGTATRFFTVDTLSPSINITYPTNGLIITDNLANATGVLIELNWTTSDINLDTCRYYNQTANVTVTCGDNATFILPYGTYTHFVYANDTLGNVNYNTSTATYDFLIRENSQTFSNSTISGLLEDFEANITISASIEISSATLIYNGTSISTGTITAIGQDRIIGAESVQIPSISANANLSFYWSLLLTDASTVNLTTKIQEVVAITLDDCSVNTFQLFEINLYDEELQTPLNGTIELNYVIQNKPSYNEINNLSTIVVGIFSTDICSSFNLTEFDLAYSAEIRYYSTDYATELYHIQKTDIDEFVNLSLYDLQLNDTTEFTIKYENEDVIKVSEAIIQLQRKYIAEDIYKTVEAPLTGEGGKAIVHIDLNTNKYRAVVVKDGIVLDIFENVVFECENELSGQCEQNLFATINPQNSVNIEQLKDFAYSVSENNGTVTTIFSVPSGTPSTVNIQLSQLDQFGNETLCNKTIISSAGSVDCTYSTTIGESYLKLNIRKNGETEAIRTYIIKEAGALDFLGNNFFIVLIFLLSIIGMAFSSPEWIIINSVMTMLIAGSLWLLRGLDFVMGLGGLMWLIVAAVILIKAIAKQEDK